MNEVIEEAVFIRNFVCQETQRLTHPFFDFFCVAEAALVPNAQSRQSETRRCDAGHRSRIAAACKCTILRLPGSVAGLLPKESKRPPLNFVEQLFICSLKRFARGRTVLINTRTLSATK